MSISVVVPIYNVEQYLARCLESLRVQTFGDLEVIMVDDGSTDGSRAIAAEFAGRDERFKLVTRPNGGLSAARNTGLEHITGEYVAFVDSDDELPAGAYELLHGTLEETGSDFATGKVLRLTRNGTMPARFLREAFRETRLRTHILKFRPLLADRVAWNKLFRRSFWDANGLRFPEGRINEDIPVMLPLHFSAKAVDVIAEPVYLWRQRETGQLSITQRRAEVRALEMRLMAVTDVHDWLGDRGLERAKRWYDESLVADDLTYYLNVLDRANEEYRQLFLDKVNALLDRADDRIFDPLPAIERLKWHLVRRRLMPELLEVLRFQREELAATRPLRVGRHWVGDYPFRTDERLRIPSSVYRLHDELAPSVRIESIRLVGDQLRVDGFASIAGIGAPEEGSQHVALALLRPGRLRRLRYLLDAIRFDVTSVHRPDANTRAPQRVADVSWSGFTATLDPRKLRRAGRWRSGRWDLYVNIRAGGVLRVRRLVAFETLPAPRAVELPATPGVLVRAVPVEHSQLVVDVATRWAAVRSHRMQAGTLELSGDVHGAPEGELKLEVREAGSTRKRRHAVEVRGGTYTARVPLATLVRPDEPEGWDSSAPDPAWDLYLVAGASRIRLGLPQTTPAGIWPVGQREVALVRTEEGDATLVIRRARLPLTDVRWENGGRLVVEAPSLGGAKTELVLFFADRLSQHAFPAEREEGGTMTAVATPAAVLSLDGPLPLPEGWWRLCLRRAGERDASALVPLAVLPQLAPRLPQQTAVGHKRFTLAASADGAAVLSVARDLDDHERGPYHQQRLRRVAYAAGREQVLLDAVVYTSFRGRRYADSPRRIHEELVRRGAPLEHVWVVRDGACNVPRTARPVRANSREHYEIMGRARYVIANDDLPGWFERRPDQVCVQTGHGTPLKRVGLDISKLRDDRGFERRWRSQVGNWQHVVSPNRFTSAILRRAYALETAELLETGYPRNDVLAHDDLGREVRRRLGLPDGVRIVLFAPTYRDHVTDRRGRFRLDEPLDAGRLRDAAGRDTVLLYRGHHYVVDAVPETADGVVRDVSSWPDTTELLLAADVLVTDYSSIMVDFANTGRPMLFYTPDLDVFRDEIRGFNVDFEATVPGPVLHTLDELADALRDLDVVSAASAAAYERFAARFCEHDDGDATARVVDRIFG